LIVDYGLFVLIPKICLVKLDEEKLRAVSPLGGVGFRPAKVANPEGGTLREAELRSSTPQTLPRREVAGEMLLESKLRGILPGGAKLPGRIILKRRFRKICPLSKLRGRKSSRPKLPHQPFSAKSKIEKQEKEHDT
jgi:hypothetical protein